MGFGILLFGYFITFTSALAKTYFFADIIGGALMLYAVYKLSEYSDGFKKSVYSVALFVLTSVLCVMISLMYGECMALEIASAVRTAAILVMHIMILSSLAVMAKEADDENLAKKARRDLSVVTVYYLSYFVLSFIYKFFDDRTKSVIGLVIFLYGIVCLALNLVLFYNAYGRLYIEGSEDAENLHEFKESKSKLITGIRRKYYESQKKALEKNNELMRQSADYAAKHKDDYKRKKKK